MEGIDTERDVFVRPPSEIMKEGKIWKLQRCMYGGGGGRGWSNEDGALCGILQLFCIFKISKREKVSFRYIGLNVY